MKAEWDRADGCAGGPAMLLPRTRVELLGRRTKLLLVASTHACRTVVCVGLPFRAHHTALASADRLRPRRPRVR
eukprot:4112953-Prymnesium_polylepis.1